MIVGIFEQVLKILELVFMVPLESRTTRIGFFPFQEILQFCMKEKWYTFP